MTPGILLNAIFFLGMGLCAIARPAFVVTFVGLVPGTADARNEIRAVYGGFGIAIAALLMLVAGNATLRPGVLLAVAAALLGMAAGRVASLLIERTGKWPVVCLAVETLLAGLLLRDSGALIQ
jgi:hypothetical protein